MNQEVLKVSKQGALNLVGQLGLREMTGRGGFGRACIVGKSCSIDLIIDDIREELPGRPYDLVAVAGGWKHLTARPMPTPSASWLAKRTVVGSWEGDFPRPDRAICAAP